jgi:hypothetical protein
MLPDMSPAPDAFEAIVLYDFCQKLPAHRRPWLGSAIVLDDKLTDDERGRWRPSRAWRHWCLF